MAGIEGLSVEGLSKRYGDIQAVDDLSMRLHPGGLIGFLGPNGAGKTTTMRAIVGMVRADAGTISWAGQTLLSGARYDHEVLGGLGVGYMPQERGLYAKMKVGDQVRYFGRLGGLSASEATANAAQWIERLGLADREDTFAQDLSGGNQQRLQLAVSLVHEPALLILDEPFAGLDPVAAETMRQIIAERAEQGAGVLFSSHQLDLVEDLCEDVVIIADGRKVAEGAISDLRAASPVRELRVRWAEPVLGWAPLTGSVVSADDHSAVVHVPAGDDLDAAVDHALRAGTVSEISLSPPSLADTFSDLVIADGATTGAAAQAGHGGVS